MTEHGHQVALIRWAGYQAGKYPALHLLFSIPNGGHRTKVTAGKLKAEGVKKGVPDLHLPVSRQGYHGLWIEMKTDKGRVSPDQRRWILALAEQGHRVAICRSWEDAARELREYLGIKNPN